MSEYIIREEVFQKLHDVGGCGATDEWSKGYDEAIGVAIGIIEDTPSADVAPVDYGHWIYGEDESGQDGYSCSECDFFVPWYYKYYEQGLHFIKDYHLCPQCGSKMDENEDDNNV